MAMGFAGVTFNLDLSGGAELPEIVRRDGVRTWEGTVIVAATDMRDLLLQRLSDVTVKPALGTIDSGTIVIEAGYGLGNLTIPTPSGEQTYRAALTSAEIVGLKGGTFWRVAVAFVIGDRVS